MNVTELKMRRDSVLRVANALCDVATKEGREFSDLERKTVADALEEARKLNAEIAKAEGDTELRQQMIDMGKGLEGGQHKARPLGLWSKSFAQKVFGGEPTFGRKAGLPPSGSTVLPSLSEFFPPPENDVVTSLLQVIPKEQSGPTFEFLRETLRIHAASPVAPGEVKPSSTYELERLDGACRTIAHISSPMKRQDLTDFGLLARYIDGALREGLTLEVEYQVLLGDGTGQNLLGVASTPGVLGQAWNVDILTTARNAVTTLELQAIAPTAWVLNPSDWETVELAADLVGQFQLSIPGRVPPVQRGPRMLWGTPVVLSTQQTQGVGVLGDWRFSTLVEAGGVVVDWTEAVAEGGVTDFMKNQTRFRAETRVGFYLTRPSAFVLVDLTAGS